MIRAGFAALLLFAFAGDEPKQQRVQGTLTVRHHVIVAIPNVPGRIGAAAAAPIRWEEHRGPRCLDPRRILGAIFPSQESVDFIMRDSTRVRARLERRCPALAFYRSLYVPATADGQICADRDSIRSRMGGECGIDQFRSLRAASR